ncbi:type I glutamate--ammonia ligase [Candidatus Bathyarchaeota archaeon]|nr:MAG: type I glutamate--ammonia ligase [Candidatus Bathyarchaeota archaeon]
MPYIRTAEGKIKPLKRKPEEVLELIRKENVKFIDLHFTDVPGKLNHTTISAEFLDEDSFTEGIPKLDGSSIRGYAEIHESDMVLKPDPSTFSIIPWMSENLKTARMICDVYWGFGLGRFSRDPRGVAQRAEQVLREMGYDVSYWGPEVEFFVFDKVSWDTLNAYKGQSYQIESREAAWNNSGMGYPIRFKEGYFSVPPQDSLMEFRCECVKILTEFFGIICDVHHHEVASAGQSEINFYRDSLTNTGDNVMTLKYVIRNVASKYGMVATFMPKPIFIDNASGMHVHVSIWKNEKNLFYDPNDEYAELSQLARYFGGGLLEHACSLAAIVAPTTSSYRRLVPGFEAPVYVAWSRSNRSACLRIPVYHKGIKAAEQKRLEFRPPDPSSNPYLCFAAILAAGLDGVKKKIDIGDPVDEDIYKLTPERRRQLGIKELPGSLKEAVESLQSDQEYLKPIFSQDLIDKIVELEINEYREVNLRPHPYEFHLYFDR